VSIGFPVISCLFAIGSLLGCCVAGEDIVGRDIDQFIGVVGLSPGF